MNTSSAVETKSPFSFKDALFKAVPESIVGRTIFWGTLPAVLMLLTMGVSFLCASPFSLYLPFLALFGGLLCLRWKTTGLCGSYLALALLVFAYFREIPFDERLWQMGIVFALAVDFFIVLLAAEEIEALIGQLAESARVQAKECTQAQLRLQQMSQENEELQKSLQEEIERLKAEAEHRRIERQQEDRRVELIQSEIELLTSQKAAFVAEAKKARAIIEQDGDSQKIIQEAEAKIALLSEELAQTRTSQAENEALHKHVADLTEQLSRISSENEARIAALTEKLNQSEAKAGESEELQARIAALTELKSQMETLQAEAAGLREGQAFAKDALLLAQERVMVRQLSPVVVVDDAQLRQLEGLHKQLRNQFEEKSRVLLQTRKELFHTQEKLLALQHEQQLKEIAPDLEEASGYENTINRMFEELSYLEEEVLALEELVSANLVPTN